MKNCYNPHCSQINPQSLDCFAKDKNSKDGLQNRCRLCKSAAAKIWYQKNAEHSIEKANVWNKANPEKVKKNRTNRKSKPNKDKELQQLWKKKNPKKISAQSKRRYRKHKVRLKAQTKTYAQENREQNRTYKSDWKKRNPDKVAANTRKRQASKLQRTPKWLSPTDWAEIFWFYHLAAILTATSGIKHVVDHIIPLKGRDVSGLHVPSNLQVITEKENLSKGNTFNSSLLEV